MGSGRAGRSVIIRSTWDVGVYLGICGWMSKVGWNIRRASVTSHVIKYLYDINFETYCR
jgi:hypothetical protein